MLQSISGMRVCVLCTACSDRNIEKTVGHTGIARLCLTQWCHRTRTDGSLFAKGSPRLCRRGRMSLGVILDSVGLMENGMDTIQFVKFKEKIKMIIGRDMSDERGKYE